MSGGCTWAKNTRHVGVRERGNMEQQQQHFLRFPSPAAANCMCARVQAAATLPAVAAFPTPPQRGDRLRVGPQRRLKLPRQPKLDLELSAAAVQQVVVLKVSAVHVRMAAGESHTPHLPRRAGAGMCARERAHALALNTPKHTKHALACPRACATGRTHHSYACMDGRHTFARPSPSTYETRCACFE